VDTATSCRKLWALRHCQDTTWPRFSCNARRERMDQGPCTHNGNYQTGCYLYRLRNRQTNILRVLILRRHRRMPILSQVEIFESPVQLPRQCPRTLRTNILMQISGNGNKNPSILDFHELLAQAYTQKRDSRFTISGWQKLVENHPGNSPLQQRLAESYVVYANDDEAISGWWTLLERYPHRTGIWKMLRSACSRKYGPWSKKHGMGSLVYFALLCLLSVLSKKAAEYDIGDIAWWPSTGEDELATVRPYMVKRQWHCVKSLSMRARN